MNKFRGETFIETESFVPFLLHFQLLHNLYKQEIMTADYETLQTSLESLSKRNEGLKNDVRQSRLRVSDHCADIRAKIDLQAESLIADINKHRQELIDEVDEYERHTLASIDKNMSQQKQQLENLSMEFKELEIKVSQVDSRDQELVKVFTIMARDWKAKLDQEEMKLDAFRFSGKAIDFERNLCKLDRRQIGSIYHTPIVQPKVYTELDETTRQVKYKSIDVSSMLRFVETKQQNIVSEGFKQLENKKYLHFGFEGNNGLRLLIFPPSFNSIECSIRFATPNFSEYHIATSMNRIVVFYTVHSNLKYLVTLNDQLKITNEFKFEEEDGSKFNLDKLTANQYMIICLMSRGTRNLFIFDWSLNDLTVDCNDLIKKIALPSRIFQFEADNYNHLFIRYEDDEENCYLRNIDLTTGLTLNRFIGFPYTDFCVYNEQLIVSYRLNFLLFIDCIEFSISRKKEGIHLTSKRIPDNDRFDIKVTKLIQIDDEKAIFYGRDKILHFVYL